MKRAKRMMAFHLTATAIWALAMPLSVVTGWIYAVAFVSVCSIYANMVGHWASYQAARADLQAEEDGG
jgi:hypothetical protein